MKKQICCLLLLLSVLVHSQERKIKIIKTPENYTAQLDVVYTSIGNWNGRMDLYTNPTSEKPTPILIHIHGGGWANGTKESQGGFSFLFKNGIAVANVEYRLRDVAKAPAAIEDVRCALIYILKNAEALNIDPNKIIVSGNSAGGHLALITGLLDNNRLFDKNCKYAPDINIAAIINKYGVSDITRLQNKGSVRKWIDDKMDDIFFLRSVSPLYHITENSPPVLTIHGDKDQSVPYNQAVILDKKLRKNNVLSKFITVENGGHGKFSKEEKRNYKEQVILFLKELNIID